MAFLTDPSISQQVRVPSLADVYLKAQAIKGNQQEQQLRGLSLQQATQGYKDQQDVRTAYAQSNGDPNAAISALRPVNQYAAQQEQVRVTKAQQDAAEAAAKVQKAKLEVTAQQTQGFASLLDGVNDPQSYQQAVQTAVQHGFLNQDELQHIPQFSPDAVQHLRNAAMTTNQQVQAQLEAQKAKEMAGYHQQEIAATTARDANTAINQAATRKIEQQNANSSSARTNIEAKRFNLEQQYMPAAGAQQTGEAFLQTLNPNIANQIKAIANGDVKMPPARSGQGLALRNAVLNYDPTFTDSRYDTKQNFKTKGDAQNIVQLTTALDHATNALQNSKEVGFAPLLGANATAADARYNQDVKLFTQEAGKLIKNGVISEHEYQDLKDALTSRRQGIRDAALNETLKLMGGKVEGLMQKYKTGAGQDLPIEQYFDKPTQQRMQKLGIGGQAPQAQQGDPLGIR
jgi:hypothetical protein